MTANIQLCPMRIGACRDGDTPGSCHPGKRNAGQ